STRKAVWSQQGRNAKGVQISPTASLIGVTTGAGHWDTNSAALVIDWTTGKEVLRVAPHVDFDAFSPDGKLAFITGADRTELWELETGRRAKTLSNFGPRPFPSPDG